jgi:hypothetical protein
MACQTHCGVQASLESEVDEDVSWSLRISRMVKVRRDERMSIEAKGVAWEIYGKACPDQGN